MDCAILVLCSAFASISIRFTGVEALGQTKEVSELSGLVAMWMIPLHFSFAYQFPLQRFLQSQLKTMVIAWVALVSVGSYTSELAVCVQDAAWCDWDCASYFEHFLVVLVFGLYGYVICGGCPLTWTGFSMEAFSGLWEFVKLSAASGVMLCLENWYYRILI
ncbi:hypothetical protein LWI29_011270 [Acer saccharum]|uniref:Uncharacterized protein n=1 Tax=Acer saccharum TaxID=4024 RepID=A0AA39TDR0_ACESA|nr:hypothetical protein LWI29_011270 [Acer saccharum]